MESQMTRFILGGKCGGLTTPVHLSLPGEGLADAARRRAGSMSDASARAPTPCDIRPRKARRFRDVGSKFKVCSVPGNRFMQVQNDTREICPRGKFGPIDVRFCRE